jgi:hypothetical protein
MPRLIFLPVMLAIAAGSLPVAADPMEDFGCNRDLRVASTGVSDVISQLDSRAKAVGDEKCAKYRQHFLVLVRARSLFAMCQSGSACDANVVRLDGTIDQINGAIAESCEIQ